MKSRYVLSPEAVEDLASIWQYIQTQSSVEMADRVESVIRERIAFLARNPSAGHKRRDLTALGVRFFPVYSYLIVYRPETKPLQIVAILSYKGTDRCDRLSAYGRRIGPQRGSVSEGRC